MSAVVSELNQTSNLKPQTSNSDQNFDISQFFGLPILTPTFNGNEIRELDNADECSASLGRNAILSVASAYLGSIGRNIASDILNAGSFFEKIDSGYVLNVPKGTQAAVDVSLSSVTFTQTASYIQIFYSGQDIADACKSHSALGD
jgi:hypothetical protein